MKARCVFKFINDTLTQKPTFEPGVIELLKLVSLPNYPLLHIGVTSRLSSPKPAVIQNYFNVSTATLGTEPQHSSRKGSKSHQQPLWGLNLNPLQGKAVNPINSHFGD